MTFYRILRQKGEQDVPPHEHQSDEVTGVFGFLRALKVKITGEISSDGWEDGVTGWKLFSNGGAQFNEDVDIGGASTTTAQLHIHNILQHIALFENDGANYPEDFFTVDANAEFARFFWSDLNGVDATLNYGGMLIAGPHHATRAHDIDFQDSAQAVVLRWDDSTDQWLFASGTAAAPALSFIASGRDDDGIYSPAASQVGIATGGTLRVLITDSQIQAEDGAASAPAYSFNAAGQTDVGFYRSGTDEISVALNGAQEGVFTTDGFRGIALQSASLNEDVTGYTNTSFADLDALTTAPFASPVAVTVTTGTSALVMLSAARHSQDTSGTGFVGYRVSGATTIAASDDWALRAQGAVGLRSGTFQHVVTGLTPGVNVFEMQARVTANAGNMSNPVLTVIPL